MCFTALSNQNMTCFGTPSPQFLWCLPRTNWAVFWTLFRIRGWYLVFIRNFYQLFLLKVSKSQKQFMMSSILPKNERNSLSWVEKMLRIVSFVRFLEELRRPLNTFEIYWPLGGTENVNNMHIFTYSSRLMSTGDR